MAAEAKVAPAQPARNLLPWTKGISWTRNLLDKESLAVSASATRTHNVMPLLAAVEPTNHLATACSSLCLEITGPLCTLPCTNSQLLRISGAAHRSRFAASPPPGQS